MSDDLEQVRNVGPGAICGDCGHFAYRHCDEICHFPRPADNPCTCRGFLWNETRIVMNPRTGPVSVSPRPFDYASDRGTRVRCVVCGRTGYGPTSGDPASPWQKKCLAGHPFECHCGRKFVNAQALSAHQRPRRPGGRSHHAA